MMSNPFSLTEFQTSAVGIFVVCALEEKADEIIRATDAGEPPIAVVVPDLNDLINEGLHWRNVERMIEIRLGANYERAGFKPVPISAHPRGRCYKRSIDW